MARRPIIAYNPALKNRARQLRSRCTLSEVLLWKRLRGRQMRGYDFHRQKPVSDYIVDFYCNELFLAIEIDGGYRLNQAHEDLERQRRIESLGVHFLRFTSDEVEQNLDVVVAAIDAWIGRQERRATTG